MRFSPSLLCVIVAVAQGAPTALNRHDDHPAGAKQSHQIPSQPRSDERAPNRPRADIFDGLRLGMSRHDDSLTVVGYAGDYVGEAGRAEADQQNTSDVRHDQDPDQRDVNGGQSRNNTPSPSPSAAPSNSLAPSLTFVPSSTPSINLQRPSPMPSTGPSARPSVGCKAEDGFFGDSNSGGTSSVVTYNYEIEYKPDADLPAVLNAVEKTVGDVVLPKLFPDACSPGNSTNNTGRKLSPGRRLEVVGFSPQPNEKVVPGVECSGNRDLDVSCAVVEGGFTLFLDGPENSESKTAVIAIRDGMTDGSFDNAHPDIVSISFLESMPLPNNPTPAPSPVTRSVSPDDDFPVWASVLIALGGLLFIGLGIFVWRRRLTTIRPDQKDIETRDDADYRDELEEDMDESYEPPDGTSRMTTNYNDDVEENTNENYGPSDGVSRMTTQDEEADYRV